MANTIFNTKGRGKVEMKGIMGKERGRRAALSAWEGARETKGRIKGRGSEAARVFL